MLEKSPVASLISLRRMLASSSRLVASYTQASSSLYSSRSGSTASAWLISISASVISPLENADTAWTRELDNGSRITIPLKNGEGSFQASAGDIERLEDEGRVMFRYVGVNPNGSAHDIAGITNAAGNVVGLMPHPEHAVETGFGPIGTDSQGSVAAHGGTDGLAVFRSVLTSLVGAN